MSSIAEAYDHWANQYDTNDNKTRDREAEALRHVLHAASRARPATAEVLEIGCGTGKNSEWFVMWARQVLAVDFSPQMLAQARQKITAPNITFEQADVTEPWWFAAGHRFGLVVCSLVLEHVENLAPLFQQATAVLADGGLLYVGELHPFRQYQGSQARFDTPAGRVQVPAFRHHFSEFCHHAKRAGLHLLDVGEWFDDDNETGPPRILTLLFQKSLP